MKRMKVLFVCTYNGARSLIAEALLKQIAPGKIEAYCSCFESGIIGPLPVYAMQEAGLDLQTEPPKSLFERHNEERIYDYVISLCNAATSEQCPILNMTVDTLYAEKAERISWSIPDFKSLSGTEDERKAGAVEIRDKIKSEIVAFLTQIGIDAEIP